MILESQKAWIIISEMSSSVISPVHLNIPDLASFSAIPIILPSHSQKLWFTCLCPFFLCFAVYLFDYYSIYNTAELCPAKKWRMNARRRMLCVGTRERAACHACHEHKDGNNTMYHWRRQPPTQRFASYSCNPQYATWMCRSYIALLSARATPSRA